MRYHLFQIFFEKMVKIKEMSFFSTRGMILIFGNCTSPPQCRSQAVACVSTPRMYPRSEYFLVYLILIIVCERYFDGCNICSGVNLSRCTKRTCRRRKRARCLRWDYNYRYTTTTTTTTTTKITTKGSFWLLAHCKKDFPILG